MNQPGLDSERNPVQRGGSIYTHFEYLCFDPHPDHFGVNPFESARSIHPGTFAHDRAIRLPLRAARGRKATGHQELLTLF